MTLKQILKKRIAVLREMIKAIVKLIALKKEEEEPFKSYYAFCLALKMRESNNNYQAVNTLGFLGAYQFGMARLCDLGYTERRPGTTGFNHTAFEWKHGYSRKIFLENPNLQDKIFREHVVNLSARILSQWGGKLGTKIKGIEITQSGCVAFAHIAGFGGLSRFFTYGTDPQDAYGTTSTSYMSKFAGYDLEA